MIPSQDIVFQILLYTEENLKRRSIMTKQEKRENGILEFHEFLKAAIRRSIEIPQTIENKKRLEELINQIVGTAVYNFNQKSSLKILLDGEWLNNQSDDFQDVE